MWQTTQDVEYIFDGNQSGTVDFDIAQSNPVLGSRLADPAFDTLNGQFTLAMSVKRTTTSTMQLLTRDTYRQHGAYIDAFHQHNGFAVTTGHATSGSGVHATQPHDGVYDAYWGASIGVAPLNTWVHLALQWTGSDTNLWYNLSLIHI